MIASTRNTTKLSVFLWLGVILVVPMTSGCASTILVGDADHAPMRTPKAELGFSGRRDSDTVPVAFNTDRSPPTPPRDRHDPEILPVAYTTDRSPPTLPRFDQNRSTTENHAFVGDKKVLSREASSSMTFDQAVSATLMADPKIRAGFEAIVQARGDLLTSKLFPNPTLTTDGIFLPLRAMTPDNPGGPPQTDVLVGYPVDWFLFGKRAAAMASARLGVRQSEADYADLVRQRVAACALAYYDVVEAKALLKLAHEDVANLKKVEAITDKALKAGNRTKVDLDRVRLDMLKSEQTVREAESTLSVAKARLRALFGRADADPGFDVAADIDAPLSEELMALETAYGIAQENRPDIQSLRVQVSKAQADTVVERRKAFPQITPSFGYSRQFQTRALGVPDADTWQVSLNMSVPIFDRNQGNRMKAESVFVQNGFLLETALVDLRADVTQAYQDFDTAQKNAHAIAQDQKKAAKGVLDAITKSYEVVGGRPYLDVLDAQRSYRETYRAYINSRANYWRAVYRFSAAIGKQITP